MFPPSDHLEAHVINILSINEVDHRIHIAIDMLTKDKSCQYQGSCTIYYTDPRISCPVLALSAHGAKGLHWNINIIRHEM